MKRCSRCSLEKPEDHFHSDRPACKRCLADARMHWHNKNREKSLGFSRQWKERNRESQEAYSVAYRKKNSVRRAEISRQWKKNNKQKVSEYNKQYLEANYGAALARSMARHAQKRKACPAWANKFFIEEIYDLAALRTSVLGVRFDVDHIVPLVSPLVCGLHVESNLRIIPATENRRKGNKWWPDMPSQRINHLGFESNV